MFLRKTIESWIINIGKKILTKCNTDCSLVLFSQPYFGGVVMYQQSHLQPVYQRKVTDERTCNSEACPGTLKKEIQLFIGLHCALNMNAQRQAVILVTQAGVPGLLVSSCQSIQLCGVCAVDNSGNNGVGEIWRSRARNLLVRQSFF